MIHSQEAKVKQILYTDDSVQELMVVIGDKEAKAINYPQLTGVVRKGDRVLLNTTAEDLCLGSGGWHFVMSSPCPPLRTGVNSSQHIMKLRYTPFQIATGSCEEQKSPFHDQLKDASSIKGIPVLIGELHSMLPIVATYIKQKNKQLKVVYIMTDKGALPLSLSYHVRRLKELHWLDGTITIGQAFGGDLEAINIYSGLLAAHGIMKADLIIVTTGPGLTGTGTKFGFSGMEQVELLHAAATLGGIPVIIPRTSQADGRPRHQGLSHHTVTVLEHTLAPVHVPILEEINISGNQHKHHFHLGVRDWLGDLRVLLEQFPDPIYTMNKGFLDDPLFFYSVALAADFGLYLTLMSNDLFSRDSPEQWWKVWPIP